tara:strand:- start:37667 stop:38371 length:705 start_codon:yes stop_codon:yes gene_type:complete
MSKIKQNPPSANMNVNYEDLKDILQGVDTIYVYPHHGINLVKGEFEQTRSGPNWEGGVVTMTTCKHLLRTYSTIKEKKVAICGVTNKLEGENFLMYVGVIDKTFESNYDLGEYLEFNNPDAGRIKSATNNRLGDLFDSERELQGEDRFDSFSFIEPCFDHCRSEENDSKGNPKWLKDIEYSTRNGSRPKCLIIEPVTVHTKPVFTWNGKLGRSGVVFRGTDSIEQFINNVDLPL